MQSHTKHFAKIIEFGQYYEFRFVVTELLGPNLSDIASRIIPCKFNLHTLLKFAIQALEILQTLHQAGFVHGAIEAVYYY
ncbi:MAG: hypothetical protein EZS28_034701 [Streblomastix strix]|uniref:Protein kinase domain-containing protein n=1 Tax=Streblomastix strix TaxID=222440 RepID=A0A5J4UIR3_9EUKA|nr:MAG: hypothetical protein EZS28_034701 [Streblomastix strix]